MKYIDLRSDTVTKPTERMREAMLYAEVGDDVYEDDSTTNELERYAAELLKKQNSLFVPSGTFANQLALFTHCNRGEEVILADSCHIVQHEAGGSSIIAGVQLRTIEAKNGRMPIEKIEAAIRKEEDIHYPKTSLICLENAFSDGSVLDLSYMKEVYELANRYHLKVHLDGARYFNAQVALGVEPKEIAKYADSINVCLSKGLCAPIGSLLIGEGEFIRRARIKRKIMGGGMRQVGILAAPGMISLREMRLRLVEDHDNAKYMAEKLESIPGIKVMKQSLDINMVFFKLTSESLRKKLTVEEMLKHNILINPEEEGLFRFVTHYYVSREDVDKVIDTIWKLNRS